MGRSIDQVIARLPKERRNRIARKANAMAKEMITYADSLSMLRRAMTKTQNQLGEVNALGADLDLVVRPKDGSQIVLESFGASKAPAKKVATRKRPVGKSAQRNA